MCCPSRVGFRGNCPCRLIADVHNAPPISGGLSAVGGWDIISAIMIFRPILLASALAWGVSSIARPLNDGWTADGAPVTLPHCWNVEDGTDGPTDPNANNHDSVAGTGYARRKVVYRRDLPPATPGLKRYLRVHAASIHAVVKVDGREIGRHAGAFTAFTFALPPDGKALEIEVDNFFDPGAIEGQTLVIRSE